jgi:hypothetical protein
MAAVNDPIGALHEVSTTEDRTLYAYRPKKRTARGIVWLFIAAILVGVAIYAGLLEGRWWGWSYAIVPSLAASAAAYCGMIDLLNRPLFQLEVDRRARTLALAMPKESGQALAKVRFGDVDAVKISEKGTSPTTWSVTLQLKNGRQIGLGISDDAAVSDQVAARFAELLGVQVVRAKNA